MREFKFRGKSLNYGEWYYGNLYDKDTAGRTHIGTTKNGCLNIDPETVGAGTGRTVELQQGAAKQCLTLPRRNHCLSGLKLLPFRAEATTFQA